MKKFKDSDTAIFDSASLNVTDQFAKINPLLLECISNSARERDTKSFAAYMYKENSECYTF